VALLVPEVAPQTPAEEYFMPRIQDPLWAQASECIDAPDILTLPAIYRNRKLDMTPEEKDLIANYCGVCPVREDCLVDALQSELTRGIRGGLSEKQRAELHASFREATPDEPTVSKTLWATKLTNAPDVRKYQLNSHGTRERAANLKERIVELLAEVPEGIHIGPDSEALHLDIAKRLGGSAILVRQQLSALIVEGTISATRNRRPSGIVNISAVRLSEDKVA
jgi:hypothetical protein